MFIKIVDGTIQEAPINYGNWINFNQDENLMKAEGYKPLILAEREENHYYTSEYEEHDDYIQEILIDITQEVLRKLREDEIHLKVNELRMKQREFEKRQEYNAIGIIEDIIKSLQESI